MTREKFSRGREEDISFAEAKLLLRYDAQSGKLFWLPRTPDMFLSITRSADEACRAWNKRHADKETFTASNLGGYLSGRIWQRPYMAHRVVWLLNTGRWPDGDIDHVNGVRTDNRISNLRDVSRTDNLRNKCLRHDNKSGAMGVCWDKYRSKWQASIMIARRNVHLGRFDDLESAIAARKSAEIQYGFHPNNGRPPLSPRPSLPELPRRSLYVKEETA